MSTRFGRSYGGYVWAIAEPLGGILLLNIAFSLTLRHPPLGTNFALFYATGIIPFFLFTGVAQRGDARRSPPTGGCCAIRWSRRSTPSSASSSSTS